MNGRDKAVEGETVINTESLLRAEETCDLSGIL